MFFDENKSGDLRWHPRVNQKLSRNNVFGPAQKQKITLNDLTHFFNHAIETKYRNFDRQKV